MEVRIHQDFTFEMFINSRKVADLPFGNCLIPKKFYLDNIFMFVSNLSTCNGFAMKTRRNTTNRAGETIGTTVDWQSCETKEIRHKAISCALILNSHEIMCKSCSSIKVNSFYKTLRNDDKENQCTSSDKRESYMTPDEIKEKLSREKRKRRKVDRRQRSCEKLLSEMKTMDKEDSADFRKIFDGIYTKDLDENMLLFWEAQRQALQTKDSRGHRWHPKVIRLCLSMWSKSPKVYEELKESRVMILPSGRLLSLYKNSVQQNAGFNNEVLEWMVIEQNKLKLDAFGREGGIMLDEMAIQEDLQLKTTNGVTKLVGLVELGESHDVMNALNKDNNSLQLATHVLQFVFLGNTGFRFPFAHWPTKEADTATLYDLFWNAVLWLLKAGIVVTYCCCDGGEANRGFVKLHFKDKDPVKENFTVINPYTRNGLTFILDFPHNVKKIRNNISKSKEGGTRNLTVGKLPITWKQWVDAYNWDQKNSLPLHHRLTPKHFELGYATKMRNHLAEQVLDRDMLNLMKSFKNHLSQSAEREVHYLDGAIQFLESTSSLVKNFTSHQAFTAMEDARFSENTKALKWIQDWQAEISLQQHLSAMERNKLFISTKTLFDISSTILGFQEFCKQTFKRHSGCCIYAFRMNSNIVENVFWQQRGRNGQNDNPTYSQYGPAMNGILLGQLSVTKKSNTGAIDNLSFYKPTKLVQKNRQES